MKLHCFKVYIFCHQTFKILVLFAGVTHERSFLMVKTTESLKKVECLKYIKSLWEGYNCTIVLFSNSRLKDSEDSCLMLGCFVVLRHPPP